MSYIQTEKLKRIYRTFKENPNKVFNRHSFGKDYNKMSNHLKVLLEFNLIEEEPIIYIERKSKLGNISKIKRFIDGYKLKGGVINGNL
jgi:hypothetical protein